MASQQPHGDGPYRSNTLRGFEKPIPLWMKIAGGAFVILLGVWIFSGSEEEVSDAAVLDELPDSLVNTLARFPGNEAELPPAVPLDPLLAADEPDRLAVTLPSFGATRLRRHEALRVRFNRPMVDGAVVGPDVQPPFRLMANGRRIAGSARWTSRNAMVFHADDSAWDRNAEAQMVFEAVQSLDGSTLTPEEGRIVVFDGTPHAVSQGYHRIAAGEPLPLRFDNPVRAEDLRNEIVAYEIGGGARTLPFRLATRGRDESNFRVDLVPTRTLEPGMEIGVALAPRWWQWAGGSPGVMRFGVQPRPQIEGVGCPPEAGGSCDYGSTPGTIVDIGMELRIRASEALAAAEQTSVSVTPSLPNIALSLTSPTVLQLAGDFEPDQVYEVRFSGLRTADGAPMQRFGSLAVRSRGHSPTVNGPVGRIAYESAASAELHFAAVAAGKGVIIQRNVSEQDMLIAALEPAAYARGVADSTHFTPIVDIAEGMRRNRFGRGSYTWRNGSRAQMAVVSHRAGEARVGTMPTVFVQATDLAPTVRVVRDGVLVWVTRLGDASSVQGATVRLVGARQGELQGTTDSDGIAWIETEKDLTSERFAVGVATDEDRAVLVMEHGRAVGPARLGLYASNETREAGAPIASVFTDRGAYRPGTTVRAHATVRRLDVPAEGGVPAPLPYDDADVLLRLLSPTDAMPIAEATSRTTRLGTASAEFALPQDASLGTYTVEVVQPGNDSRQPRRIGTSSVRVAQFRQPTFRVDFEDAPAHAFDGAAAQFQVSSQYLFGAPVAGAELRWSLLREGAAGAPARYGEFSFAPADAYFERGTLSSGALRLDEHGQAQIDAADALTATQAQRYTFEVNVVDRAGQATAAHHNMVVYPAATRVGIKTGRDWVDADSELSIDAVTIDAEGEPVVGAAITGRFLREGWHSWWEWSGNSEGAYRARREQRRELLHTCRITSEEQPAGCSWTPARPGTYVLEVETRDSEGRTSIASRRLYVAGPDEAPDRDAPGAPIQVTPARPRYAVGEVAELAVENPWEAGELLLTVENDGVLQHQRHRLEAGGHVLRVPVTEEMVPNAFISVALIRPRVGEPGEAADPGSPDLRFGLTELEVSPPGTHMQVEVEAPTEGRPGDEVEVVVHVRDEDGPRSAEVALWAVDEGLLRLTGYELPNPTTGLYPRQAPRFSWDDLRTALASRITPEEWRRGGDGAEEGTSRALRPDEDFPEPTPLWRPSMETDSDGVVRARFTLPDRATEYRIMAVAIGEGVASGGAQSALSVSRDFALQEALPRFATAGDTFEAVFFVHATGAAVDGELEVQIGDTAHTRAIQLAEGATARIAIPVTVPSSASLQIHARLGERSVERTLPIAPRGRWRAAFGVGAVAGAPGTAQNTPLMIRLPEADRGRAQLDLATHPFLGLSVVPELIEDSPFAALEQRAALVLAWAAQAELSDGLRGGELSPDELSARGSRAVERLLELQTSDGSFGRWSASGWSHVFESALGVDALVQARAAGFEVPQPRIARALMWLAQSVNNRSFADSWDVRGDDALAFGLRVLADGEQPNVDAANALFNRREALSISGRAHLAFALEGTERSTLIQEVTRFATIDHSEDEAQPWWIRQWSARGRVLGPALEAACMDEAAHESAGQIAGMLLEAVDVDKRYGWQSALDAAFAAKSLAAYARLFRGSSASVGELHLDGTVLSASSSSPNAARLALPFRDLAGQPTPASFVPEDDAPLFFHIEGDWTVPLGPADTVARGRAVALHRRFETSGGRRLEPGDSVPLGEMVRVRLFVFTEGQPPAMTLIHDPMGGGFEAIESQFNTTADNALRTILGVGPDDDAMDPRGFYANRSAYSITHRALERNAAVFGFDQLPSGLQEYTYVVRATTPGEFTLPPAEISSAHDPAFIGRSAVFSLNVVDPE